MQSDEVSSALLNSIPGIQYGWGDARSPFPKNFSQTSWEEIKPNWKQIHGTRVAVFNNPKENLGECDGFYTEKKQLPIAIATADCVPILLARKDGRAVAGLHAGWRGTLARIVESWARLLIEKNDHPSNWIAALGPSVCGDTYEVSNEIMEKFFKEFPTIASTLSPKVRYLDLHVVNSWQLKHVGVQMIERIPLCTKNSLFSDKSHRFHSYRREGTGTRQYSVIMLR